MLQDAVFDSSFWVNAHRSGLLPYVLQQYRMMYPPAVARELRSSFPSGQEFWRLVGTGELEPRQAIANAIQEFGAGEREAISLAMEHRGWVLFLDDRRPFEAAAALGLNVICTPVLAISLYSAGTLTAEATLRVLATLARMQTISPHLVTSALAQLGQIWKSRESG